MGKVGVGLKVESTHAGYVVSELVPKGPAEASGKIRVGDLVVSVDGFPVTGNAAALPPLMIGMQGSQVTIGFQRHAKGPVHEVKLQRQGPNPEVTTQQRLRKTNEAEDAAHEEHGHGHGHQAWPAPTPNDFPRLASRPYSSQGPETSGRGMMIENLDVHAMSMETMQSPTQDVTSPASHISLSYSFQPGTSHVDSVTSDRLQST
jgi:hypothetical protein